MLPHLTPRMLRTRHSLPSSTYYVLCNDSTHTRSLASSAHLTSQLRLHAGELTVSRALGDFHLAQLKFRTNGGSFEGPLTAEPEVRTAQDDFAVCSRKLLRRRFRKKRLRPDDERTASQAERPSCDRGFM